MPLRIARNAEDSSLMDLDTLSDGIVALRPWRLTDAPAVIAACRDSEIERWLDQIPQPYGEDDARAYLEHCEAAWRDGTAAPFAIVDAGSGEVIGSIGLRWLDAADAVGEVGYWVAAPARGRGVATRALRLLCRWAIDEAGAERLQLRADVLNVGSQRVAERAGFTREGVLRSSHLNRRRHRRVDFVLYSLLPAELA